MLTGPIVILTLKAAVVAVTFLLVASLVALAAGRRRLHGRINVAFFALTLAAVVGLEVIVRVIDPTLFRSFFDDPVLGRQMRIHLCFSVPAAILMPVMLFSGVRKYKWVHLPLAVVFLLVWGGTLVTGVSLPSGPETAAVAAR